MGRSYLALCNECGTEVQVNEGPSMSAMPFRCESCGREWWWQFGPEGPVGEPSPPRCGCGGKFSEDAPPRCPQCRSTDLEPQEGYEVMYD